MNTFKKDLYLSARKSAQASMVFSDSQKISFPLSMSALSPLLRSWKKLFDLNPARIKYISEEFEEKTRFK